VEGIASLAGSIVEKGLFQPIAVRPDPEREGGFILVMGERRWRAHQHVGIPSIRAFIIPVTDPDEAYELALIENIQREDLNPLEEAEGICQLMQRRGYNQREVAKTIGKSESQVSRLRKLTTLPDRSKKNLCAHKFPSLRNTYSASWNRRPPTTSSNSSIKSPNWS